MADPEVTTDYLIVGGGMAGLAFADELLTRTNYSITIVDKRDSPGGHWNDSYPFVRLHGFSIMYGVESRELAKYHVDEDGPNKGFMSRATGTEIVAYAQDLMRERLLPSGRVKYFPSTEYLPDGTIRGVLSHKPKKVKVRRRIIDASYLTNTIPATHKRSFLVDSAVTCIPPNDLPRLASSFQHFTVLGAGKTAVDAVVWLLNNGAAPDDIRWIIPNDYWYVDRAKTQPAPEFVIETFGSLADVRTDIGIATSVTDLVHRHEQHGYFVRLDRKVEPRNFHYAVVSQRELAQMRSVRDVVRKGHVTALRPHNIELTKGSVPAARRSLYIDCTANGVEGREPVPVFQPNKIVLQITRGPRALFAAAQVAFLESLPMSDEERNSFAVPISFCRTVEEYVLILYNEMQNSVKSSRHPQLRAWEMQSRLAGYMSVANQVRPEETDKVEVLSRLKKASGAAMLNLPRLVASVQTRSSL